MGLDLTLIPVDSENGTWGFGHSLIDCERRNELFEPLLELEKKKGRDVPEKFNTFRSRDDKYEESHYGPTVDTPYGDPLKCVYVKDLLPFAEHEGVRDNWKNRAVWAYLREMPPDEKIALYWH